MKTLGNYSIQNTDTLVTLALWIFRTVLGRIRLFQWWSGCLSVPAWKTELIFINVLCHPPLPTASWNRLLPLWEDLLRTAVPGLHNESLESRVSTGLWATSVSSRHKPWRLSKFCFWFPLLTAIVGGGGSILGPWAGVCARQRKGSWAEVRLACLRVCAPPPTGSRGQSPASRILFHP